MQQETFHKAELAAMCHESMKKAGSFALQNQI